MQPKFRRLVIGATALAVAAGGLIVSNNPAQAATGDAPDGSVTIPASQALTSPLGMAPNPAPAICEGITSDDGTRWHAFISDAANDPAAIVYTGSGATAPIGFTSSLLSTSGTFITNQNTSSIGQITPIPGFDLSLFGAALVPGEYNIGFACSLAGETTNFWSTPVTITATTIDQGAKPAQVQGVTAESDAVGEVSVSWNPVNADPAVTDYSVLLSPVGSLGTAVLQSSGGATSLNLTGVDQGIYQVFVAAENSLGEGAPSALVQIAVAGAPATIPNSDPPNANGDIPVKVFPELTRVAAAGFTPGSTVSIVFNSTPIVLGTVEDDGSGGSLGPDLDPTDGAILVDVLIPELDGDGIPSVDGPHELVLIDTTGNIATVGIQPVLPNFGQLEQEVIVDVPAGVITFSQTCGKFGDIDTYDTAPVGLPGLPSGWTDQVATDAGNLYAAGQPRQVAAPAPLVSCDIIMESDPVVLQDVDPSVDGAFYYAEGSLNQVTVIDSRDTDSGWQVTGQLIDDFVSTTSAADVFDGNYLGWHPYVAFTSPVTPDGYTQTVTKGDPVLPGTGTPGNPGSGMKATNVLGTTPSTSPGVGGLGRADLDARMAMYIPVADSNEGLYTATLVLTLAEL